MNTAIITGASRGIGRAIALLFGKNGYNVIVNYVNSSEKLEIGSFYQVKIKDYVDYDLIGELIK